MLSPELRRLALMVDYLFGEGVSRSLPDSGFKFVYSKKSGRLKLVFHEARLFATVKPTGSMALSIYGAELLSKSPAFIENCVTVTKEASEFVSGGKSVFCKFVKWSGSNIYPKSEVAILDPDGTVLGVGLAVLNGKHMAQFKSGVAVKVRAGLKK